MKGSCACGQFVLASWGVTSSPSLASSSAQGRYSGFLLPKLVRIQVHTWGMRRVILLALGRLLKKKSTGA